MQSLETCAMHPLDSSVPVAESLFFLQFRRSANYKSRSTGIMFSTTPRSHTMKRGGLNCGFSVESIKLRALLQTEAVVPLHEVAGERCSAARHHDFHSAGMSLPIRKGALNAQISRLGDTFL